MTLEEFIDKVIADYGLAFDKKAVREHIMDEARKVATGNIACVDDDTVKEWILNFDPTKKAERVVATVKTVPKPVVEKKFKPVKVEEKKPEVKKDVQLSLFDDL